MGKENVLMMKYIDILKKTCIIDKRKRDFIIECLRDKKIGWLI